MLEFTNYWLPELMLICFDTEHAGETKSDTYKVAETQANS
jgi:hypothetical protein